MTEQPCNSDRFRELPEELIFRIFSLLEMKDVVKTGILSKSWRNLWTQVDNLVYKCIIRIDENEAMCPQQVELSRYRQSRQIVSFVDRTLMRCTGNIKKLDFFTSYDMQCTDRDMDALFDKWITHVVKRNVELLKLKFMYVCYIIPDCVYLCSSCTKLKLHGVEVWISSPVNWPALKSLCLQNMYLDNGSVRNMLIGSPALENIALQAIDGLNQMDIVSPSVKKLKLVNFDYLDNGHEDEFLRISAPWLQELEIFGKFLVTGFQLVDVSSLVRATVMITTHCPAFLEDDGEGEGEGEALDLNDMTWYNNIWIDMVAELVNSLGHVGELIIGLHPIQVLTLLKLKGRPSPLFNCKHATIDSALWKYDLPGIACLLDNAPHLETLLIKAVFTSPDDAPLSQIRELFNNGDPHLSMPNGTFVNLRSVKIDYSQESCYDNAGNMYTECLDFDIIKYILRSVVALEKLVLYSSPKSSFCKSWTLNLSQLLNTFLITNKVAEWEFKEINGRFEYSFPKGV